MPRPQGQLERSLAALTIGVHQAARTRRRALLDTETGPTRQLVQVPLSGQASSGWGYTSEQVKWEQPFLYAPGQWLVPFATPHFEPGFHVIGSGGQLLLLQAHVIGWKVLDEGWTVGATIQFASCAPNASAAVAFSAVAHLTFTGYATPAEGGEFAH